MTLSLTENQRKRGDRAMWIERAIEGAERFSGVPFTSEQEVGIAAQFNVLIDQLDIAVEALERIVDCNSLSMCKVDQEGLHVEKTKMPSSDEGRIAKESLNKMKSSKFSI